MNENETEGLLDLEEILKFRYLICEHNNQSNDIFGCWHGSCETVLNKAVCVCDSGWNDDNALISTNNCASPTWLHPVNMTITGLMFTYSIYLYSVNVKKFKTTANSNSSMKTKSGSRVSSRNHVILSLRLALLSVLLVFIEALCFGLFGTPNPIAMLCNFLVVVVLMLCGYIMSVEMFIKTAYALVRKGDSRKLQHDFMIKYVVCAVILLISCGILLWSHTALYFGWITPFQFNYANAIFLLSLAFGQACYAPVYVSSCTMLVKTLEKEQQRISSLTEGQSQGNEPTDNSRNRLTAQITELVANLKAFQKFSASNIAVSVVIYSVIAYGIIATHTEILHFIMYIFTCVSVAGAGINIMHLIAKKKMGDTSARRKSSVYHGYSQSSVVPSDAITSVGVDKNSSHAS